MSNSTKGLIIANIVVLLLVVFVSAFAAIKPTLIERVGKLEQQVFGTGGDGNLGGTSNFNRIQVDWVATPNKINSTYDAATYQAIRRCQLKSLDATTSCSIINDSGHNWIGLPQLIIGIGGTATRTHAQISMTTSTIAGLRSFGGAANYWNFSSSTAAGSAPLKVTLPATSTGGSALGSNTLVVTGTTTLGGKIQSGYVTLKDGEVWNCNKVVPDKTQGDYYEVATSSKFNYNIDCLFN